jgi:bifunctional UDP-N-acetylglucosamine pyrophosphorylase/glucosamine-1-phosphate N-acetyltransferase
MEVQPIILAAGQGTRMGGELPKVLTQLHGQPLISYLLKTLGTLSLSHRPVIVVGYRADMVQGALGAGYSYALQEPQLGTGHAVMVTKDVVTAPHVAVLYGDTPFVSGEFLQKLFQTHAESGSVMTMATVTVPDFAEWRSGFASYGRILRGENGEVLAIREYKDANDAERAITEVNPGMYVFESKWLFEQLGNIGNVNAQGEYYLTDIVDLALQTGNTVPTLSMEPSEALGVNTPEHLEHAAQLVPSPLVLE